MTLQFSKYPGARERHLRRKYDNPLFPVQAVPITQSLVDTARRQDLEDLQAFQQRFQELVEETMSLKSNVDSEVVLLLKERLDRAYEQASLLQGDQSKIKAAIERLVAAIMQAVWKGAGNDMQARQELEQEESARDTLFKMLAHPLIADILDPDSPICEEELVPVLLSESESALVAALHLFDQAQLEFICSGGRMLLGNLDELGGTQPEAWLRLRTLEAGLERSNGLSLN